MVYRLLTIIIILISFNSCIKKQAFVQANAFEKNDDKESFKAKLKSEKAIFINKSTENLNPKTADIQVTIRDTFKILRDTIAPKQDTLKPELKSSVLDSILIKKEVDEDILRGNREAKTANVLGILSLALFPIIYIFTLPLAILAVIFGKSAIKRGTKKLRTAKNATIMGIISIVLNVAYIALVIWVLSVLLNSCENGDWY
jgi:hypothetical protein